MATTKTRKKATGEVTRKTTTADVPPGLVQAVEHGGQRLISATQQGRDWMCLAVGLYRDKPTISYRAWYQAEDGGYRPSKYGLNSSLSLFTGLMGTVKAHQAAFDKALAQVVQS
jgi:hypothetical protein